MAQAVLPGVEWSQSEKAFGLLRVTITLPEQLADTASQLELCIDQIALPLLSVDEKPWPSPVLVNIHTHLLDNGSHQFAIAISDPQNPAISSPVKLEVRNSGKLAARVRSALQESATPIAFVGPCDASHYDYQNPATTAWFDRDDADQHIQALLDTKIISSIEADMLAGFVSDGFLVLPETLSEDLLDRACTAIDDAVAEGYQSYQYGDSTRLEQMHQKYPAIREIWLHPRIHHLLNLLFDEVSEPCQSLVYVFGSQQDAHQDTIHLTPYPAGYMCGVWVALEDVREGSGELVVYPGSHRLPRVYMNDVGCEKVDGDWSEFGSKVVTRWSQLLEAGGFKAMPYLAKRGSILIWHENLMHAGSVRRDLSLSRRSVVTHNFARGALVYYDSSGWVGTTYPEAKP